MNSIRLAIYFLSAINVGLFVFLAYLALRGWKKNITNRYYFFLLVSIIGWLTVINAEGLGGNTLLLSRLDFLFASCVGFSFTLFAQSFNKSRERSWFARYLPVVIFAVLIYLSLSKMVFVHVDATGPSNISKSLYSVYIVLLAFLSLGIGGSTLYRQWKGSDGIRGRQLSYVLFGFIIPAGTLFALSAYNVLLQRVPDDAFSLVTNVGIIFTLLCSNAIFRYRLLNLRQAVGRAFVYIIFYGASVGIFIILATHFFSYLTESRGIQIESALAFTIVLIITLTAIVQKGIRYLIKIIIFPPLYKTPKVVAPTLQGKPDLPLQTLLAEVLPQLQKQFRVKEAGFLWYNPSTGYLEPFIGPNYQPKLSFQDPYFQNLRQFNDVRITEEVKLEIGGANKEEATFLQGVYDLLEKNSVSMLIPFGLGEQFLGAITLGKRKGAESYSEEEVAFARQLRRELLPHFQTCVMYYQAIVGSQGVAKEQAVKI